MKQVNPTTDVAPPISDDAVKRATGRDWVEWCRLLDNEGATKMKHGEIARMVHDKFNGGDWWSQMVTVGYEKLRGLRVLHQKGGGFEITRSKTISAPLARVYKAWHSAAMRRKWLADPDIDVSTGEREQVAAFRVGGWEIPGCGGFCRQRRQDGGDGHASEARGCQGCREDEKILGRAA